jgi:tetratricopeptide (TPR) repeat protein
LKGLFESLVSLALNLGQPAPPDPDSVMTLPPELVDRVEAATSDTGTQGQRVDRLVELFHGSAGLDFKYQPHPTRAVAATYAEGAGNCLAFTLAFIAAAREAGLEAYPREVRVPPQWRRDGGTVLGIGHVNAGVDTPERNTIVDFEPDLMTAHRLAQPFRGRRIGDRRALAHFYNNRAAELVLAGRPLAAWRWAERSIELDASFAPARVTRGALARRAGRLERAEADFLAALEHDPDSASALFHLVGLERSRGNLDAMIAYGRRLENLAPDDPYLLRELGRLHREIDEPALALGALERAVDLTDAADPILVADLLDLLFELDRVEEARLLLRRSTEQLAGGDAPPENLHRLLARKKQF